MTTSTIAPGLLIHYNEGYRFGFNGKEMDNEMYASSGNSYDYGFRIYNPRLGRFLSVDPLTNSYPWYTPYQYAANRPIACIDMDGLEDRNYLNDLIKEGTQILLQKAWDVGTDVAYNATISLAKDAKDYTEKKVKEQTIVVDVSWSKPIHPKLSKSISPEVQVTAGVSFLRNIGGDKKKGGVLPHIGLGVGLNVGSSGSDAVPTVSLGLVGGNFNEAGDYRGAFADYSADISGFGGAYCYWPGGADAKSITFNAGDLAAMIASEGVPNASFAGRLDYYFIIPQEEGDPSFKQQFNEFKELAKKVWHGESKEFDKVMDDAFGKMMETLKETETDTKKN
ncbi:MAG: hypothetical protein GC178_01840 [Flavobacteriales bacterium]|nr:hypothetical protein [Flavobacteriales bacterium]